MSYGGNPATDLTDRVRFKVGDTNAAEELATNAEIAYALGEAGTNVAKACEIVCRAIAARFARFVNTAAADVRVSLEQRVTHYLTLADGFKTEAVGFAAPACPSISISLKTAAEQDTDRVQPSFEIKRGVGNRDELSEDWRDLE